MNTKLLKATLAMLIALGASSSALHATVTLQFSTATAKLTNIQNAAGNASGGLRWGIVVDTTGNGFFHVDADTAKRYDGFTFPSAGSGTFLNEGSVGTGPATDDFFYFGATGNLTLASVGGTDSGTNAISQIAGVPLVSGVTSGDQFALIWFDTSTSNDGDKYGFLTDASFVIPSDTSSVNFNTFSLNGGNPDPVRNANFSLGAAPEPSRALLAGLGLFGLMIRRRRK